MNVTGNALHSIGGGGLVFAKQINSGKIANVTFSVSSDFSDLNSENNGGSFYIDHPELNLNIVESMKLVNSIASGKGGVFYIL